jgi:D-galactose 1-dehydrogenase
MNPIRIAVIGLGKIARGQHIPAIAASSAYELIATVDLNGDGLTNIPHYQNFQTLLDKQPHVDAVVLCTPPQMRGELALRALRRGLHVFLEKPPGVTQSEISMLHHAAKTSELTLFASWHSRFAAAVEPARHWLSKREIKSVDIVWREDVRVWHPQQNWIWEPAGLGVFDPGINALSIATYILPHPLCLREAALTYPANRNAPIAAKLFFSDVNSTPITMDLDWRQTGPQSWNITVRTDNGICQLSKGGAEASFEDTNIQGEDKEYAGLYAHFAELIRQRRCNVDLSPFTLVTDALLQGRRVIDDPFFD